jgi:hypothetical protein
MPNRRDYPAALAEFLPTPDRPMGLTMGKPSALAEKLAATPMAELFGAPVTNKQMADCAMAGLWCYHNGFEESHGLSQAIETPTGSYWHGILHRREPDYFNAKYWFRRVGNHPVFSDLRIEAAAHGMANWDAFSFTDTVERAVSGDAKLRQVCEQVQMAEWWLLFDFCFTRAMGR